MRIIFCHFCGKQVPDGANFCKYCGNKIQLRNTGNYSQQNCQPDCNQPNRGYQNQSGQNYGGWNGGLGYDGPGGNGAGYVHPGNVGSGAAVHQAVRTRWIIIGAAALCAIAAMIFVLFIKASTPEDTIAKIEHALNKMDTEELLECFDEQTQNLYSGALGVGSELVGMDLGAWSDLAGGLGGLMAGASLTPKFKLEVMDIQYHGSDACLISVNFQISYQGDTESETETLPMVKKGREWVVSAAFLQDFMG